MALFLREFQAAVCKTVCKAAIRTQKTAKKTGYVFARNPLKYGGEREI